MEGDVMRSKVSQRGEVMQAQIFGSCTETTIWKCLFATIAAFAVQVLNSSANTTYWLLLYLYFLDFGIGFCIAVVSGEFDYLRFRNGCLKFIGYILLIVPLILTDANLNGAIQEAVYQYIKNWCLLYLATMEIFSIFKHARRLGIPVPTLKRLAEFKNAILRFRKDDEK